MIVPMERLLVAGSNTLVEPALKLLHRAGTLHVTNSREDPFLAASGLATGMLGRGDEERLGRGESLLFEVKSALAMLAHAHPAHRELIAFEPGSEDWLSGGFHARATVICNGIFDAAARKRRLEDELGQLRIYRRMFEEFKPLVETAAAMRGVEISGFILREAAAEAEAALDKALTAVTGGGHAVFRGATEEGYTALLLVYPAALRVRAQNEVFARLAGRIHTISVPPEYERATFADTLTALFERETRAEAGVEQAALELREYAVRYSALLKTAEKGLDWAVKRLRVRSFLARSERTFWISGWIPREAREGLENEMRETFGGGVLVMAADPHPDEYPDVPVLLRNGRWAKPFERLLRFFPPPVYGSVDPTVMMMFFFPLFFGLILGDVGYALIMFGMALFFRMRRAGVPLWNDVTALIAFCGIGAFSFGVLYGEFFGKLWGGIGLPPPFFDRKRDIIATEIAVLALGGLHLTVGNLVGGAMLALKRRWRHAALNFLDAATIWAAAYVAFLAITKKPLAWEHAGLIAAPPLLKVAAGGMKELLEIPKLVSNILSYSRLMALGLASVMLADVADDFYTMSGGVLWGIVAAVALHLVNFALGLLSPAIQSLRLHYVEFFNQFYKMGNRRYEPFRTM
ncbi:MAG: hypothetical protein HZA03_00595 [Nitrospinae bacterium]|nr:hypothetical protein [Nitrospinota bacterium]